MALDSNLLSPESMLRPSLSDNTLVRRGNVTTTVAGVYAPAFVERSQPT